MDIDESPKYQFIFVMDKYLFFEGKILWIYVIQTKIQAILIQKQAYFQYIFEGFYRYAQSDCIYEYLDKLSSLIFLYELWLLYRYIIICYWRLGSILMANLIRKTTKRMRTVCVTGLTGSIKQRVLSYRLLWRPRSFARVPPSLPHLFESSSVYIYLLYKGVQQLLHRNALCWWLVACGSPGGVHPERGPVLSHPLLRTGHKG